MGDGEALIRVGVERAGLREVTITATHKAGPTHSLIAAPRERVPPEAAQPLVKEFETVQVRYPPRSGWLDE
jgi:hypothetical protein